VSKEEDEVILVGFLLERNTHTQKRYLWIAKRPLRSVLYL
jgi:hypothetical protein